MSRIGPFIFLMLVSIVAHGAIVIGNSKGDISLTEIYDYQCPHCQKMYPLILQLIDQKPNLKVQLIPIPFLNHESLVEAAIGIACAYYTDKFELFNAVAMSHSLKSNQDIKRLLDFLDLDNPKFIAELHSQIVKNQLKDGTRVLKKYHIKSVPVFLIYKKNKKDDIKDLFILRGEQPLNTLQEFIDYVKKTKKSS